MYIRLANSTDRLSLLDVWKRSVQATHSFVTLEDQAAMLPQVQAYFSSAKSDFWLLCGADDSIVGFMGMSGREMESLFLVPEFQGRGGGRQLVRHAQSLHDEITTDVNEQNVKAKGFYEACGFVVVGRSEFDNQGRPYPLLKLQWKTSSQVH